ncbi:hypothetical protein ABG067_005791 [Albugo candida]
MTFDKIIAGNNLIGRARTGMGKTLAFALPVVEKLLQSKKKPVPNRAPRVICVTPTRELARQVTTEFEKLDTTLTTVCIYGGTPYQQQNASFRSGTDIVIGTTGRIMDHIDRGNLRFANCEFLILDEADTMLEMGFRDDIQRIFDATQKSGSKPQILLFSATIPKWLHEIADRYMDKTYEFVNLVSDSDDQASLDVQHIAIPCHWQSRPTLLASLLSVYAKQNARTIIFAETKKDCNELSVHPEIKQDCQVLHGDIAQDQRETTMKAFRQGQIKLLIATDVAARGLDMNVDLVINSEPPRKASGNADVDTYVHRSGRTGRAGKKGICITLYTTRQKELLDLIERKIGNKFIMRHQPTQEELIKVSAEKAFVSMSQVDPTMISIFREKAQEILDEQEPIEALAAALACITGHVTPPRPHSIMSGAPDYVTVLFSSSKEIRAKGYVWNALNRDFDPETASNIKQLTITQDSYGACFDLPSNSREKLQEIIDTSGKDQYKCPYSIPTTLPKLQQASYSNQFSAGSGRGRGRGREFGRGRGRGRRFG